MGQVLVGGGGVISLSHFHIYFSGSEHTNRHEHTYTCVYTNHLESFNSLIVMFSFVHLSFNEPKCDQNDHLFVFGKKNTDTNSQLVIGDMNR